MSPVINYLAVLACAIVAMVLGTLWYGPLFGKKWMALTGIKMPSKMDADAKQAMYKSYGIMLVGSLVTAFVLAHTTIFAMAYTGATGWQAGLMSGFWNWLGFVAPIAMGPQLWEKKPWSLWVINAGFYLVLLCINGTILAVWR